MNASLWRDRPLDLAVRIGESDVKERTLASEGFHEPLELLDEATVDHHRAMTSLCEELEAIDWYDQRVKATSDESLAAVLAYNRDDEKEHAAMALEWLRRRDPALDANLRKFLFTSGSDHRDRRRRLRMTPQVADRRARPTLRGRSGSAA